MSPEIFFILFLFLSALIGSVVIFLVAYKPIKRSKNLSTSEEIKSYFEDLPLKNAVESLEGRLKKEFRCFKCQSHKYEIMAFDEDLHEVYCIDCGFKNFYHVDLLAGTQRSQKKKFSPWPKEFLKDINNFNCLACKSKNHKQFKMTMDIRYKFSGYGETKKVILYLLSCNTCGYVNFFDRERS